MIRVFENLTSMDSGQRVLLVGVLAVEDWFRHNFGVSAWVQHERWLFPVIQPNVSNNVTAAVEFMFQPKKLFPRASGAKQP